MRITFILFFVNIFQAVALESYSQTAKISLKAEQMTLTNLFSLIEKQSEFLFFYVDADVQHVRVNNMNVDNVKVEDVLDKALTGTHLAYTIKDRNINIYKKEIHLPQQAKKKIVGVVMDENGESVIGANILQKDDAANGTTTDLNGRFALEIPERSTIVISYIGYNTQEVLIRNQTNVTVVLVEDNKTLEEIVVVGYGTQKKANLTGAVSTVSSEVLEDRPLTNLGAGLQGVIPNLTITSSSGAPGTGSTFNIRGITNMSGQGSPLILIDGIEMDPNLLNPSDVKDVTVLKDAASAAIYGARAAFGVILITTKTGFVTQKPIVSFSANYSINKPTVKPEYMDSKQYTQWMNDANTTSQGRPYFDDITMQHVNAYYNDPVNNLPVFNHPDDAANTYRYCGNTDWYNVLNKKSYPMQQYNVSIQGGNPDVKYFTSAGFFKQDGISKWTDEDYKRYNILQNITYKAASWIEIGLRANISIVDMDTGPQNKYGNSSIGATIPGDSRPIMPLYHPDGNFAAYSGNGYFTNLAAWQSLGGSAKMRNNNMMATGLLKLTPFEGFTVNMDYTYNYYNYSFKNHVREYWDYDAAGPAVIFPHTSPNQVRYNKNEFQYDVFNIYAEYDKKFAEKHHLKGMVGFNQEGNTSKGVGLSRNNLIVNDIPYLSLATGERAVSDYENEWRTRGAFFRLNYIFDEKYLLEVNGRYDGSSRFPKDDRFEFFPSFSAGWRLSNEDFWFPIKDIVNDFKIRGSYGSLGNQAVGDYYPYISTYGTGEVDYLFSGAKPMGVYAPGLVSDMLTWETVSQWDIGFDFGLLDNKLTGVFDYYARTTKDMLTKSKALPAVLGTGEPQANAADLRTSGWELTLSWKQLLENGINYSVAFNLADYQTEITKYDNPIKSLSDNFYEGKKWGEIWGFVTDGFFKTDEEAAAWDQSKVVGYTQYAGDIKFADIDGKPGVDYGESTVDNPGDRKIIGNSTPRYNFGFRGTGEWKGIDLTLFFQGTMKRDIQPSGTFWLSHYTSEWAVPQKMNYDYWREDNQDAFFPRARISNNAAPTISQTHFLENGAYIRLKQLAIGYTIPKYITEKANISKLRVYFNADNLWEYSKMPKTFDPELATVNAYPFVRSYSFGVNLSF